MPSLTFTVTHGSIKFAVPISIAVAPTIKNSIASSAEQIPPSPTTGILTALATCHTIRKATGFTAGLGGIITCIIKGCPEGLGEPEFDKLDAALGYAMMGINAVKGVEFGKGFDMATCKGSDVNDIFTTCNGNISTLTNNSGGIQGGISNGEDIVMRIAFKPVATLLKEQNTVDIHANATTLKARGRHDPCVLPRAVPIVEAMAAMTILDYYLINKSTKI